MKRAPKVSSRERLLRLPAVFSLQRLLLEANLTPHAASQLIWRWEKSRLIRSLGGRAGVYFNLVRDLDWQAHLEEALAELYPEGVMVGARVLAQAGWTTQHAHQVTLAILPTSPTYRLEPLVQLVKRPRAWYNCVAPAIKRRASSLRVLTPVWALADASTYKDMPGITTADIDWPIGKTGERLHQEYHEARQALRQIGLLLVLLTPP